jgi:hypothetical protein
VGQLLVTRVVCQDLKNVEFMYMDKNDPFVTLQFGAEEKKTEVIYDGGSNVTFDFLNIAFDVDKNLLDFESLKVSVADKNSAPGSSDKPIGSATTSLRFMQQKVGEKEVQLPMTIYDDKKKETGKVILFLSLMPVSAKAAKDEPLDPLLLASVGGGELCINRMRAHDLVKPKTLLGGYSSHVGNPYIKLSFASWQHKTAAISVAKAGSPIFDNLDLSTDVTAAMLKSTKLLLEVYDDVTGTDVLVGKGECSLYVCGVKLGEEKKITVDIVSQGATAGTVVVYALAQLKKPKPKKEDIVLDKTFEVGYLRIKEITAHNLKNTELMGGLLGSKQVSGAE